MSIFTIKNFPGVWPVGTAAVVVADDEDEAAELLNAALKANGMPARVKGVNFETLDITHNHALILNDGDY